MPRATTETVFESPAALISNTAVGASATSGFWYSLRAIREAAIARARTAAVLDLVLAQLRGPDRLPDDRPVRGRAPDDVDGADEHDGPVAVEREVREVRGEALRRARTRRPRRTGGRPRSRRWDARWRPTPGVGEGPEGEGRRWTDRGGGPEVEPGVPHAAIPSVDEKDGDGQGHAVRHGPPDAGPRPAVPLGGRYPAHRNLPTRLSNRGSS